MKKVSTLLSVLALSTSIFAQQPPNGGFESWTTNNRNPTGWSTVESAANNAGFGFLLTGKTFSTKETTAGNFVEGTAAASVQSDSLSIPTVGTQLIPGILFLSKLNASLGGFSFEGTPFTSKPDVIKFAYRYVPNGADTANFFVGLSKFNTLTDSSDFIGGAGEALLATNGTDWDSLSVPIDYDPLFAGQSPDSLTIGFFSSGQNGKKGSKLWVDDVKFVYSTPNGLVELPVETPTVQVYPNPANNIITLKTTEQVENNTITIYALDGKQVISKGISNGQVDVRELAAGRYFFTLSKEGKATGLGNFNIAK